MRKVYLKKRKKVSLIWPLYCLLVIILTVVLYVMFNKNINSKLDYVARLEINKSFDLIGSNYDVVKKISLPLEDLLVVSKNNKGEILTVDYQMEKIYEVADLATKSILEEMRKFNSPYFDKGILKDNYNTLQDGIVLSLPMGIVSDFMFLNNLGPKIPVLVRFINRTFTNVKTKITNYGMNNALVEVYLEVSMKYDLLTPVTKDEYSLDYTFLLGAKMIQGTVPNWYGGELISKSNVVS